MWEGSKSMAQAPANTRFVPWTFRQTLLGTGVTLIPWLTLAIGGQVLAGRGATQASVRPPSPALDATNGAVLFVVSSVVEGAFLLAPLYYAFAMAAAFTRDDKADSRRQWRARWHGAVEALGLTPGAAG